MVQDLIQPTDSNFWQIGLWVSLVKVDENTEMLAMLDLTDAVYKNTVITKSIVHKMQDLHILNITLNASNAFAWSYEKLICSS